MTLPLNAADAQTIGRFCENHSSESIQKVVWNGKTVHEARRTDTIRIMGTACAIILAVGLLLFKFMPIIAGLGIGMGLYLGYCAYNEWKKENHLEKALIHLLGSKEKIDQLPQTKLSTTKTNKVPWIKPEDMTDNIMRVAVNGETYGVAFKCKVPDSKAKSVINTVVRLYLFKEPFSTTSGLHRDSGGAYSYDSFTRMTSIEGKAFEIMVKRGCFTLT